MVKLQKLKAEEILDSRGDPTLLVEVETEKGTVSASVPSGASVGVHEALELRDGDPLVHGGRGVSKAIAHVNETIAQAVVGESFDQERLDTLLCQLDGTPNKRVLGANAILGVSIAFARAEAQVQGVELYVHLGSLDNRSDFSMPQPLFNVLNGGKHAHNGVDIQECMLAPVGFSSVRQQVQAATACVTALESLLKEKSYATTVGDEGGFAPALSSDDSALDLLVVTIGRAGYSTDQIKIALDVAASSFYKNGKYVLSAGGQEKMLDQTQLLAWYAELVKEYPLISIEDGFAEDDWDGFIALQKELGDKVHLVGDDLIVTNVGRMATAMQKNAVNACIIKPNQIGTVSEAIKAVQMARTAGWKVFASHRSGETMDTFIADFAVGLSCDYLKAGAPTRKERTIKYDRLIEIEDQLRML